MQGKLRGPSLWESGLVYLWLPHFAVIANQDQIESPKLILSCFAPAVGAQDVVECSYVESSVTDAPYFSSKVKIGPNGLEEVYGLGQLSAYEQEGLNAMMAELKEQIQKGVDFVKQS